MRNIILLTSLFFLTPFETFADTTTDAIAAVTQDVREVCTQPSTQGEHWQITGDVSAEGGINLKLLKIGSVTGKLHFAKDEWSGVKQVLDMDQARDNADYRKCVEELAPKFIAKLKQANAVSLNCQNATLSNCAGINAGQQIIYFGGYTAPPPRVISVDNDAAAVKMLQAAPHQSTVFLIYAGKRGVEEIGDFYGQLTKLFLHADHWRITGVENVGPSTGTADGATLTGEGIGCSTRDPPSEASEIAKKAMALTGYPCSREAADYGMTNYDEHGNRKEQTTDIVISIGTRFIPPS